MPSTIRLSLGAMVFSAGASAENAGTASTSSANPDTIHRLIVNLLHRPNRPAGSGSAFEVRGSDDAPAGRANAPDPADDRPGISAQRPPAARSCTVDGT